MSGYEIALIRYGDTPTDAIENCLELRPIDDPDSKALASHEVLVSVKAAIVSFVDFIMMTGQYQHISQPPYVPGLEFSGEVLAVGSDVEEYRIGDRVFSDYQKVGPRSKGNYQACGGWCTHSVVPQEGLHKIPQHWSFAEASSFLANFETGYFALRKRAEVQPGETVLVTGASGAAGMATVQLAKQFGAKVIATGRSDSKLAQIEAIGADGVINSTGLAGANLRAEVKRVNNGRDVDVVIDTVGGSHGRDAFRCLAFEGRFVIVGWASNVSSSGGRKNFVPDELPTNIMQMKCLKVMGSPMVIYCMGNPDWRKVQLDELMELAHNNRIRPIVGNEFDFQDYKQAALTKYASAALGSCILNIS